MPPSPAPNRRRVDRFTWDRTHFRRASALARWKFQLCLFVLVVFAGGLIYAEFLLPGESRHSTYTHGPVARVHAAWANQCEACHTAFSSSALSGPSLTKVYERWHDFRCETCHHGTDTNPKDYAPHHVNLAANGANVECGFCHREHRGSDASLIRAGDAECTQCHKELANHHVERRSTYSESIGRFPAGSADSHSEFRPRDARGKAIDMSDKKFSRTLKFNHELHLMKGIVKDDETLKNKPDSAKRFDQKKMPELERYRRPGQKDGDPVNLECASCHQLDTGRQGGPSSRAESKWGLPGELLAPARPAGAYMLPIVYEQHCQACHPLTTGPVGVPWSGISVASVELPHRLTPEQITRTLADRFLTELSKANIAPPATKSTTIRDRLDPRVYDELKQLKSYDGVARALAVWGTKQLTMNVCGECHQRDPANPLKIEAPNSPSIWYPHAKFNHAAHHALDCRGCHAPDFPKDRQDPQTPQSELLNLPGIDNCRQCHAPAHQVAVDGQTQARGGVRHDCIDCHRYHNGDFPLQGPGSPRRDVPATLRQPDAAAWLRGLPTTKREKQ